jgi:hypothetical protein
MQNEFKVCLGSHRSKGIGEKTVYGIAISINNLNAPMTCARMCATEPSGPSTSEIQMAQLGQSSRMSPDPHLKAGEDQYLDYTLGVPLKSLTTAPTVAINTTTLPCAPPPLHSKGVLTAMAIATALPSVLASSRKRSTMHCALRQLLSQYLQSLKKAHPPPVGTQNVQSSLYPRGLENLGPN